jgi:hypothetical protein
MARKLKFKIRISKKWPDNRSYPIKALTSASLIPVPPSQASEKAGTPEARQSPTLSFTSTLDLRP